MSSCLIFSDDEGVGHDGDEPVDVGAKVDLHHVAVRQHGVQLGQQGAVVANHSVHRDTCWESNT